MTILTHLRHRRPLAVLLLIAGLLAGQSMAAAHLHADGAMDVGCAVCSLAKSGTAVCDGPASAPATVAVTPCAAAPIAGEEAPARPVPFRPRGPPHA